MLWVVLVRWVVWVVFVLMRFLEYLLVLVGKLLLFKA